MLRLLIACLWLVGLTGYRHHSFLMSVTSDNFHRKNVELYTSFGKQIEKNKFQLTKPEILSPAGGWPQLKAAVAAGCDAVYFGLQEGFNARARASNFMIEELEEVMHYLHDRGKKGYLVINILVFEEEMDKLQKLLVRIAKAGVDALIMQDIGAANLVKQIAPNLPVHGSTQMTITDGNGAAFVKNKLSIERVVVGRELSIDEISSISQSNPSMEVEAFVHGALCVSYSGQCFSSEAWGGRSANRGQCAQACRMPYGLIVNGTLATLTDDVMYLLSPQDLMAVDYVPQLIEAGVKSFKIEGRLKGPEYVSVTTKAYRNAVDEAWDIISSGERSSTLFQGPNQDLRRDLKQTFSRGQDEDHDGLSPGFLLGPRHQSLVIGKSPKHRGLLVGKVVGITDSGVTLQLSGNPLKRGDGVVFDQGEPEIQEEGGSIYDIYDIKSKKSLQKDEEKESGFVTLSFGRNSINLTRVKVGSQVWKTKDSAVDKRLQSINENEGKLKVCVKISGKEGETLKITLTSVIDGKYIIGEGLTNINLEIASKSPISKADLIKSVGSLGDSTFKLDDSFEFDSSELSATSFIPMSEIKIARRNAIHDLTKNIRAHGKDKALNPQFDLDAYLDVPVDSLNEVEEKPTLSVMCRNPEQVKASIKIPWVKEILLDFLEIHGLRESVELVKLSAKKVIVATPRIIKPDEEKLYSFYLRLRPDVILVRSAGFLNQLLELGGTGGQIKNSDVTIPELWGDSYLNAANSMTAKLFLESGLSRLAPTHDLNADQVSSLARSVCGSKLECVLHLHLPIFHTEHCIFCKFLSDGNSYRDCGHPCERNDVSLRDMNGEDHLVLADQGCRNTVFNAKAQSGAAYIDQFLKSGIKHYRIELVDEPGEFVEPLLSKYRDLIEKGPNAQENLLRFLDEVPNRYSRLQGFSAGSLEPIKERERGTLKPTARR